MSIPLREARPVWAAGVHLAVNLNTLIGSDFAVDDWRHHAVFNTTLSRIEMHLKARRDTTVHWPSGARRFAQGERIHTENSYKYALADFVTLLRQAGYRRVQTWTDAKEWFALCHAYA